MKTFAGLEAARGLPESAVAIGTFDGVHVGHRSLIARTVQEARERGLLPAVLTWDRHPLETLRPEKAPPLLTGGARKAELIETLGVEALVVMPFDREFSTWSPDRFVQEILGDAMTARSVFVGEGWRFGHGAAGDVDLLRKLGAELSFEVATMPLVELKGQPCSSSRTREAVLMGDMELASTLLARPFDVDGTVVRGEDRGRELGFPTANLDTDPRLAMPRRGIYAGRARAEGRWYPAAIDVGVNPTFGGDPERVPLRIEAYLLDFEGDVYGRELRVEFWTRLRDEERFSSVQDLVDQMHRDVQRTRAVVGP